MTCKKCIISSIVVFIYIYAYEFLVHGLLLQDLYMETAELWRTPEQIQEYCVWAICVTLALAMVITFIFTRNFEDKSYKEGLRFGLLIGLFMGVLQLGVYPYMPIPITLVGAWFVASLVEGVGAGVLLAFLFKK